MIYLLDGDCYFLALMFVALRHMAGIALPCSVLVFNLSLFFLADFDRLFVGQ